MRRNSSTSSGFTLVELLLVMAILVIVVAMVVPSLQNFTLGRRTSDVADNLVAIAGYARTQSISEGRPYRLNFDQNGSFWLTAPDDSGQFNEIAASDFRQHVDPPVGVTLEVTAPKQSDGGIYITFMPSGLCDPASVEIRDSRGSDITVECLSPTEMYHVRGAT